MRLIFCTFLAVVFSVSAQASQTMAKFIFEDAEKAFSQQDFNTAISKLNEAEQALGKTNMPILNLRINARYELLKQGPFYLAMHDLLKADMNDFLENYGSNPRYENEARQVYRLSQELKSMREKDATLLASQEEMAENGDINSIEGLINRYSSGTGVNRDDKKAAYWRTALVAAQVKAEEEAAQIGNIEAMRSLLRRYTEGDGVEQDQVRAEAWSNRLAQAEEQVRRDKEGSRNAALQEQIDEVRYFPMAFDFEGSYGIDRSNRLEMTMFSPTLLVGTALFAPSDIFSGSPTEGTKKKRALRQQMVSRPAAWAFPDSMIGKAFSIYQKGPHLKP